ncbi:MAG: tetratricopeptide repeat protein [Anaerolineae bacterium]
MGNRCPQCGHVNPIGARYCEVCAAALANLCPRCGTENPPGFRFCGICGVNLFAARLEQATTQELERLRSSIPAHLVERIVQEARAGRGERRTVTVLFADLTGFTSLSENLDPEEVFRLLDTCFRAFVEAIYRFEGTVDKFTGDGLMALFGAPLAHEDDAERALHAALGLQAAVKEGGQDLSRRLGRPLALRIGLNMGEVVVGGLGSDLRLDYTAVGDTVNVAARLQELARPGEILVARSVAEAARAAFTFEPLGPVEVRGRREPVEVYRLVGPRAQRGPTRGLPGILTPLVGRAEELGTLVGALQALEREARGRLILVTGEAGIGKSRLVAEALRHLEGHRILVAQGASLSFTQSIGYWLVQQALRSLFRVRGGAEEDALIRARARELAGDAADELLPYLLHLMEVEVREESAAERLVHLEPALLRQQTFLAVREFLAQVALRRPLLLILEDLHWVDRPSLDLLLFLLGLTRDVPLAILGLSRPEGEAVQRMRAWAEDMHAPHFLEVALGRLPPGDSDRLAAHLLQTPGVPQPVREWVVERAEGNPFFMEELVRMLMDRGLLRQVGGEWAWVGGDVNQVEAVPSTLQALIAARVDTLAPAPREVLQVAAVAGRSFSPRLLEEAVPRERREAIWPSLSVLEERGLITAEGGGEEQFAFRHGLIRDTVYGTLLQDTRQDLHRRVGQAIETLYQARLEEQAEVLAYHFSEGRLAAKAIPYLLEAGGRAAARFANEEAIRFYTRALEFLKEEGDGTEYRVRAHSGLGDVLGFVGQYEAAVQEYLAALALEEQGARPAVSRRIADLKRRIARTYLRQGNQEEALQWLQQALRELDLDPGAAMAVERARVYNDLGWLHFRRGEMQEALAWTTRCLSIVEGTDHYGELAAAYNRLVGMYFRLGDWEQARDYAERGLRLRQRMGDTYGLALSYTNLGGLAMFLGDWDQAIAHNQRSLELKERLGDVPGQRSSCSNLGLIYLLKGAFAEAEKYLQRALNLARETREHWGMAQTLANLTRLDLARGQWGQALDRLAEATRLAEEAGAAEQQAELAWLRAEALLGLGRAEEALDQAQQAVRMADRTGDLSERGVAQRVLGAAWAGLGVLDRAEEAFRRSLELLTEARNRYELGRTYGELGRLYRRQGFLDEARDNLEKALAIFRHLGAAHDERAVSEALLALQSTTARSPGPL